MIQFTSFSPVYSRDMADIELFFLTVTSVTLLPLGLFPHSIVSTTANADDSTLSSSSLVKVCVLVNGLDHVTLLGATSAFLPGARNYYFQAPEQYR